MPDVKASAAPAEASNAFRVTCVCGTEHQGRRRRRYQQIICNDCATPLFVLPVDVYPSPVPRTKAKGGQIGRAAGRAKTQVSAAAGRAGQTAKNVGATLGRAARWLFTPIKVALMLVTVLISGSLMYVANSNAVDEAERVSRVASVRGFEELGRGDIDAASESLREAVVAFDRIGEESETADKVRQVSRELAALTRPATGSLLDLLDEVVAAGTEPGGAWGRSQQTGYRDSWMVLDADVTRSKGRTRIALPIRVGDDKKPVRVRADLDVLEDVPLTGEATRLTLAVQVGSVTEFAKGWDIELNPDTAFLWESFDLYPRLGFAFDALSNPRGVVAERLRQQAVWQGHDPDTPVPGFTENEDADEAAAQPEDDR